MIDPYQLYLGDCLDVMKELPTDHFDLCIADLPYGGTDCAWDVVIPFEPMWEGLERIVKSKVAILLFGSEPFSSQLRLSNLDHYRYDYYWDKKFAGNYVNAKIMPMKTVECISVFCRDKLPVYYPEMVKRTKAIKMGGVGTAEAIPVANNSATHPKGKVYDEKYPITLLPYPRKLGRTKHPTQKLVSLLRYLVRMHTKPGDRVIDITMGVGSTGVACAMEGRRFTGIEKELPYYHEAEADIDLAYKQPPIF